MYRQEVLFSVSEIQTLEKVWFCSMLNGSKSSGNGGLSIDAFPNPDNANGLAAIVSAPGGKVAARGTSHIYIAMPNNNKPYLRPFGLSSSRGLCRN